MREFLLILAVFVACSVEAVEALTIVLAVGLTRGWRSALQGVVVAVVALAVVVAALGPALTVIPIDSLRLVVGGLLLVFGIGWLRKAMLRASRVFARLLRMAKIHVFSEDRPANSSSPSSTTSHVSWTTSSATAASRTWARATPTSAAW